VSDAATTPPWGADSEYGRLHDVLLCPPDNFEWRRTSVISKATLDSGRRFEPETALGQHREMVAAYEQAGVEVHYLEPDPHLPYQVFARDSSVATPAGPVVSQLAQPWRRGEYAAVIEFYERTGVPIHSLITAGTLEGGDVIIVEPGKVLIGNGEERTDTAGAAQLAAIFEGFDWEARIEPIPGHFVHIDVLVSILAPKLAAVCVEAASGGLVRWLDAAGFEIIEVSVEDAFGLGVNAISLGEDRVISTRRSEDLNAQLRARGLEVLDPDLEMFTLGGGGAHCLAQALRRERLAASARS
jgi:N-dimethylarginine dimethylaminohydrolase